jgi:tetratricopeptide (TPR) repeat protein
MKKLIFTFTLFAYTSVLFAQSNDYRTTEDGMTKLINNSDFINDVVKLGTEPLTLEKLDSYFAKYVPEYSNFKIDNSKIDFNNLYYVNSEGVSNELIADKLGSLLKLKNNETQNLKNILTGNISYTQTSGLSTGLGNELYERGKDKNVDYVVDYSVDFFQNKLGDGAANSALIDIGGGLLGAALTEINKNYYAKLEEEKRVQLLMEDDNVYSTGVTSIYDNKKKTYVDGIKPEQQDLLLHFKATQKIPNAYVVSGISKDYDAAIKLLNDAILLYRKNSDRAYYLYKAYVDRALCKMQTGAYRGAIIDYYFAQGVLEKVLEGKFKDQSVYVVYPEGFNDIMNKKTYGKGKIEFKFGALKNNDLVIIVINRAFAKYRAKDYNGAVADAEIARKILVSKNIIASGKPNDYKDIIETIVAMSQFGLEKYTTSYKTFSEANLNDDLFADTDKDGITNFLDPDNKSAARYYGLPNYFTFDIAQIKGMSYYKANKIDDAISIYEYILTIENTYSLKTFTRIGGDVSSIYSTLGSLYFTKGDKAKAIKYLDDAIKLNPNQLEYYFKRGTYKKALGLTKEADADFKIVKNPESLKVNNIKKSPEYYSTKYTELATAGKTQEQYLLIKEAMQTYPDNDGWFVMMIRDLKLSKNSSGAKEISEILPINTKKYHIMRSFYHAFSSDNQKDEEEMLLAFDNGLGFYESSLAFQLSLRSKPYYCKLLTKYMSKTNNNFIPLEFDKAKMAKELDSSYSAMTDQYKNSAVKGMAKSIEDGKKTLMAKALGNYEEYLTNLNSNKILLDMSAIHAIDKIECLFILNRREEAIKFAKQVWSKGKLMKPMDNPLYEISNGYYYAIENIAKGTCD